MHTFVKYLLVTFLINAYLPSVLFIKLSSLNSGGPHMESFVCFLIVVIHLFSLLTFILYLKLSRTSLSLNKAYFYLTISNCVINFGWLSYYHLLLFLINQDKLREVFFDKYALSIFDKYTVFDLLILAVYFLLDIYISYSVNPRKVSA